MYSTYSQAPTGGGLALAGTLTSATELVVMVSEPAAGGALPQRPQGAVIRGVINATGGATGGGWTIKCRQGSTTAGTQVGITDTYTYPATTTTTFPYSFNDTSAAGAPNGVYCVTVTAAGSNGTFNDGSIEVYVPTPAGEDI